MIHTLPASLPPERRAELVALANDVATRNAIASDLMGSCTYHWPPLEEGCGDCKAVASALQAVNISHSRYHFALQAATMAAVAEQVLLAGAGGPEPMGILETTQETPRPWWRRLFRRSKDAAPPARQGGPDGAA